MFDQRFAGIFRVVARTDRRPDSCLATTLEVGHSSRTPPSLARRVPVHRETAVGQHHDVIPTQPPLRPPRVGLDIAAQRVAGLAGLPDRFDAVVAPATDLPPALAVVPHLATLDLQTMPAPSMATTKSTS